MPAFAITVDNPNPPLKSDRTGQVSFTVTNKSPGKMRGQAWLEPEDKTHAGWLTISDGDVRDFDFDGVQQFVVRIAVPPAAPATTCKFKLNMKDPLKGSGEENAVAGPTVSVTVPALPEKPKPPFPWWIVAVAAGVLVLAGAVTWYVLRQPDTTGQSCKVDGDCDSGQACVASSDGKICLRKVGTSCEHWDDCATLFCAKDKQCDQSKDGDTCQYDVQCVHGNCQNGTCAAVVTTVACNPACQNFTTCQNGRCVPWVLRLPQAEINRSRTVLMQKIRP